MPDQELKFRLQLENGQFVGTARVSEKAMDRLTAGARRSEQANRRYNRAAAQVPPCSRG